ncbi:pimeloyl-ACP methyl ester carboxylesterase [Kineococcus xinjiangensis]|uniref:Pimeloyl-ACP methyl ester carboxylesterase n=1 Tax=Kineococcus xinjiangensis TaxID=512762 RepID=A0A2S6ITK7_9ACTN|nr:alpha/beta hydrolase [Kineococcus xinjiangensis]PPK97579.1 pimeloyl-ACP methyl ester carboxylesterase [Kineococcus xinjiangensis]
MNRRGLLLRPERPLRVERTPRREPHPAPASAVGYGSLRGEVVPVRASDGTALHVEVDEAPDAAPDAPTVVFGHGYGLNLDAWHHQRAALRGRYRLVLWDHRGHGRSAQGPAGSGTIQQVGDDLHRVLAEVAPRGPLALVGHSMGGMAIMALAAAHPDLVTERVRAVALVATSAGGLAGVDHGIPVIGPWVARAAPYALALALRGSGLVERGRRLTGEVEQRLVRRWSYASPVPQELSRFTAAMVTSTRLEVISDFLPTFSTHDEREALAALAGREVLVLAGERDLMTPASHSAEIAELLPGSRFVLVRSAGHLLMLEHPAIVNPRLLRLLERACGPGRGAPVPAEVVSPVLRQRRRTPRRRR